MTTRSNKLFVINTKTASVIETIEDLTLDDKFGLNVFLAQYNLYVNNNGPKPDHYNYWCETAPCMIDSFPYITFAREEPA